MLSDDEVEARLARVRSYLFVEMPLMMLTIATAAEHAVWSLELLDETMRRLDLDDEDDACSREPTP